MAGRTGNFTAEDKSLLLDLLKKFSVIENKKTDATTTKVI